MGRHPAAGMVASVAVACVLAAGLAGCSHNPAAAGPVVRIDLAHPGAVLPPDYLGLSFEASVLGSVRFDPAASDLPALLTDLGTGHLRFGGNSVDRVAGWAPVGSPPSWASTPVTPAALARLARLTRATGWRVDLGLSLLHPDPPAAAQEAADAARLLGPGLFGVQLGNEPDDYPAASAPAYGRLVAPTRAAVAVAAPGVRVEGPDTAAPGSLVAYAGAEGAGLAALTQHYYPLTRCGGRHPTIGDLLSAATRAREQQAVAVAVASARRAHLPLRFDELNSASCGGQDGVSNTLAAALWMVDFLLLAGQAGTAGVGIQGGLAACRGYSPLCVRGAAGPEPGTAPGIDATADASLGAAAGGSPLAVQPDFYALLVVHQLEGGRWLPLVARGLGAVRAYAVVMPGGAVRVVLDNPGPTATGVTIAGGPSAATASVLRLTGPSPASTTGVTLGGRAVAAGGGWVSPAPARLATTAVTVPAGSAALVTLAARRSVSASRP